jgi:hypothetical protein
MTEATLLPLDLPTIQRKIFTVDFYGGNQSCNAGRCYCARPREKIGICRRLVDKVRSNPSAERGQSRRFGRTECRDEAAASRANSAAVVQRSG